MLGSQIVNDASIVANKSEKLKKHNEVFSRSQWGSSRARQSAGLFAYTFQRIFGCTAKQLDVMTTDKQSLQTLAQFHVEVVSPRLHLSYLVHCTERTRQTTLRKPSHVAIRQYIGMQHLKHMEYSFDFIRMTDKRQIQNGHIQEHTWAQSANYSTAAPLRTNTWVLQTSLTILN